MPGQPPRIDLSPSSRVTPPSRPSMRAPTTSEKIANMLRDFYEGAAEQPLVRIADMLGMTDIQGMKKSFTEPDTGMRLGMAPIGPPGGKLFGAVQSKVGPSSKFGRGGVAEFTPKEPPAPPPQTVTAETPILMSYKMPEDPRPFMDSPVGKLIRSVEPTGNSALDAQVARMKQIAESPRMSDSLWEEFRTLGYDVSRNPNMPPGFRQQWSQGSSASTGPPLGPRPATSPDRIGPSSAITPNASGESMASLEAINRMASMKGKGQQFVVRKGGTTRPLIGPEAVDYVPRPGEEYGILENGLFKLLQRGGK